MSDLKILTLVEGQSLTPSKAEEYLKEAAKFRDDITQRRAGVNARTEMLNKEQAKLQADAIALFGTDDVLEIKAIMDAAIQENSAAVIACVISLQKADEELTLIEAELNKAAA